MNRKHIKNIQNLQKKWKIYTYSQFFRYETESDDIAKCITSDNSKNKYLFMTFRLSNPAKERELTNFLYPQFLQLSINLPEINNPQLNSIRNSPYVAVAGFTSAAHNKYRFFVPVTCDNFAELSPTDKINAYTRLYYELFEYFENEVGLTSLHKGINNINQCFRPLFHDEYFFNNISSVKIYYKSNIISPVQPGKK
jgi:hypothetical protein